MWDLHLLPTPTAGGVYSNSFLPVLAINELALGAGPIIEDTLFPDYLVGEEFVFNSIFRAQVTDINSGLDDGDANNDVDTYPTRYPVGTVTDFTPGANTNPVVTANPPVLGVVASEGNIDDPDCAYDAQFY